ncbi:MAG TPA: membrane protein insertase YidC [Gemmataceae bacterium]|jgi:YidC/Oxa1 family membrane protein insertase
MQQKNLLLAFLLSFAILAGWAALSQYLWPPPPPKPKEAEVAKTDDKTKPKGDEVKKPEEKEKANDKQVDEKKPDEKNKKEADLAAIADLRQLPATPPDKLVRLGAKQRDSKFHLFAELDPRGAGVRSLWLNKYQAADVYGRPEWSDAEKKEPVPLELIPASLNAHAPSFQTFGFDVNEANDDQPLDTLGRVNWSVLEPKTDEVDGRRRESVSFQAETQGVVITKTYSLIEGEYHLGLEVKMRRKEAAEKSIFFRYQMTGAHGLPVEGKWYTSTFRNALIALDSRNGVSRDLQDLRQISNWGGGNLVTVTHDAGSALLYAGVANQYFASMMVVDDQQKNRGFLHQARPTLETTLSKGTVVSVAEDGTRFVLKPFGNGPERTFYASHGDPRLFIGKISGRRIAVLHHTASTPERNGEYPEIATEIFPEDALPSLWVDDITVRVSSEPVELRGDVEVVHKYLVYNGPVKVSQLFPPPGLATKPLEHGGVQPELYDRYHEKLHLNTLTDYHTPGAMGEFANKIYWTGAIIWFTNVMHVILGYFRAMHLPYGLCIVVLTVLVRGLMFPLSRKQAMMSVRMQQLAPELKKLQEKYKDDRQALGLAQMELYRKHGVNPFGSCWVLLLQMPVFMGLYFSLQESTHFRLAPCWPWIPNLAAPDMLFNWGEHIPWISRIEDYGSFLYLGPYFNLLPIIGVVLMIAQQKMMTPPPADEQQAMQQKMMTYMMAFFGLMFYKWPAGLCLYFIATSSWGFCERKLLPKKKLQPGEPAAPTGEGYIQKLLRRAQGEQATPAPAGISVRNGGTSPSEEISGRTSGKRRRDKRRQTSPRGAEDAPDETSTLGRWRKRLHDWWVAVLKEAEKKHRS